MSADHALRHGSQRERVFALLSDLQWHAHYELASVGGNRYTARILELKRLGYIVESKHEKKDADGKRYRLLSLLPSHPQPKRVKVFLDEHDARQLMSGIVQPAAIAALRQALASFEANRDKL